MRKPMDDERTDTDDVPGDTRLSLFNDGRYAYDDAVADDAASYDDEPYMVDTSS